MTEQLSPEQLLRAALELAKTDLEAAQAHAESFYRSAEGEARHEAHRVHFGVGTALRTVEKILEGPVDTSDYPLDKVPF